MTPLPHQEQDSDRRENDDPVDLIQEFMDREGISRSEIFGSSPLATMIMTRKRSLSLSLIRRLHFEFGLPADKLIRPYKVAYYGTDESL